jgi:hypothetical protein
VAEIVELADDARDIARSRAVAREVQDLLAEPEAR